MIHGVFVFGKPFFPGPQRVTTPKSGLSQESGEDVANHGRIASHGPLHLRLQSPDKQAHCYFWSRSYGPVGHGLRSSGAAEQELVSTEYSLLDCEGGDSTNSRQYHQT